MPLDPGTAALLQLIEAAPYPPMYESTPQAARTGFRALTCDGVTAQMRVPVGSTEELTVAERPARLYRPDGEGPFPTLVFLHGGGFVIGDLDTHDQTCRRICSGADVVVLAIDYRLAPEAVWPAAVDDALAAVTWAADHLTELGGTDVLAVGGDSAGGNLSTIVAQTLRERVQAQLLVYPATDFAGDYPSRTENAEGYFIDTPTMLWFAGLYLPEGTDPSDPRVSPMFGELAGIAPAVIVTAEYDPLRDEGEAYAAALEAAGVPVDLKRYDSLVHGFLDMGPMSQVAADAVEDTVARFRRLLHG